MGSPRLEILLFLILMSAGLQCARGHGCPNSCVCQDTSIECTCLSPAHNLTLSPFVIEYIRNVYIHSCNLLHIPKETFAGLAIGDEIIISEIGQLTMAAAAFRGIQKYPDRMEFRNVKIPQIPSRAFEGVNNAKNIWFRNCRIGEIKPKAFKRVSSVQYLYFHSTTIQKIRFAAFSPMLDIGNVFFRGEGTEITEIEDHIFYDTELSHSVVFHTARIQQLHSMAFNGLKRFKTLRLENTTVRATTYARQKLKYTPIENGGRVELTDLSVDQLSLNVFSNVQIVHLRRVKVGELMPMVNSEPMVGVQKLIISHSHIQFITDKTFADALIDTVDIRHTQVDIVYPSVFDQAEIRQLHIHHSNISKIQSFAFEGLNVTESMELYKCRIGVLDENAFGELNVGGRSGLQIKHSRIDAVLKSGLGGVRGTQFTLSRNTLGNVSALAFESIETRTLNLTRNTFEQFHEYSLSGMLSQRKVIRGNIFPCQCNSFYYQLFNLLTAKEFRDEWIVRGPNYCKMGDKNVRMKDFRKNCNGGNKDKNEGLLKFGHNLLCRQMIVAVVCRCNNHDEVQLNQVMMKRFPRYTGSLRIQDCSRGTIGKAWLDRLRHLANLYISINQLHLAPYSFTKMDTLRRLEFQSLTLSVLPKHTFNQLKNLDTVRFRKVIVNRLEEAAFFKTELRELAFEGSQVRQFRGWFVGSESAVKNLSIVDSNLGEVESHAFERISSVSIRKSTVTRVEERLADGAASLRHVCLAHSRVQCECANRDGVRQLLQMNHCEDSTNECIRQSPLSLRDYFRLNNKNLNNQPWSSLSTKGGCFDDHVPEEAMVHDQPPPIQQQSQSPHQHSRSTVVPLPAFRPSILLPTATIVLFYSLRICHF